MQAFGVFPALATPFGSDGSIALRTLVEHAEQLLSAGLDGVTLFGTTGEGASIGTAERNATLSAFEKAKFPMERMVLGVCANSAQDAIETAQSASAAKVPCTLLLPPFYFKDASEQGLYDWFSQVLSAYPDDHRAILYHIPQVSGVGLSANLVARIKAAFPDKVRGVKDSSGDWDTAERFMAIPEIEVLIGDERLLHRAVPMGCAGAISGMANLYGLAIQRVLASGCEDQELTQRVDAVVAGPVIAALKAILFETTGDPNWERLRAPLEPLKPDARYQLLSDIEVSNDA